jgi:hypothetical protein
MFSVNYTKIHRIKEQILVFVLIWEKKEIALQNQVIYSAEVNDMHCARFRCTFAAVMNAVSPTRKACYRIGPAKVGPIVKYTEKS